MTTSPGLIENPLSVIAIFAGIAEVAGTGILPFISAENQLIYIWFLMIFPSGLVLLFFLTLHIDHTILYAPSDFNSDDSFLQAGGRKATYFEVARKAEIENHELAAETPHVSANDHLSTESFAVTPPAKRGQSTENASPTPVVTSDTPSSVIETDSSPTLAEVVTAITSRFRRLYRDAYTSEIAIGTGTSNYIFDGVLLESGRIMAVEIKYLKNPLVVSAIMIKTLDEVSKVYSGLPRHSQRLFSLRLIIVVVEKIDSERRAKIITKFNEKLSQIAYGASLDLLQVNELSSF